MHHFKTTVLLSFISLGALLSPVVNANTNNTVKSTTYGDNPNIIRVLAGKTQQAVQNTAEKIGAATERGIAKIKPTVDNTWQGTKDYTTEQAVIARDNTRQGIDTAVQKVRQTKENIVGTTTPNNVHIQRGNLSQNSTTVQPSVPQYVEPTVVNVTPSVQNTMPNTPVPPSSHLTAEPEIQRQSLPIQNSSNTDSSDAGIPR